MQKFQIHQSGLSLASSCGEAFRRRYIEGEKLPARSYQAVGSAVDRSVGANLGNKIETGDLLPLEQVVDLARDQAAKRLEDFEPEADELTEHGSKEGVAGAMVDKSVRLARAHAEIAAPRINAVDVAAQFVLDLEGYDFELAGEIDILEDNPEDNLGGSLDDYLRAKGRWIRDTKTAKKTPSAGTAAASIQLTTYALAEYSSSGKLPAGLALDTIVDLKRETKVMVDTTTRNLADFDPLLARVQALVEAMQAGIFMPANPADWRCSEKYCGYFSTCAYARRPTTVSTLSTVASRKLVNIAPAPKPLAERVAAMTETEDWS